MKKILHIAFQGATHGNFLRFVIDKMSKRTPDIQGIPFTDNNTSHLPLQYSDLIGRYHPTKSPPHFKHKDEPHILITVEPEDLQLLERSAPTRTGDFKVDITQENINIPDIFAEYYPWADKFKKYYNLDILEDSIPKFIMRDFYKLSFLDPSKSGFIEVDKILRQNKPADTFEFPVSHFWNEEKFYKTLQNLSGHFDLEIQQDETIHKEFIKRLPWLETQHRADDVIDAIKQKRDMDITDLDTVEQAYLSAWIEKNNDYVVVPLCNSFFKNTGEIMNWLAHYPQQYKAMNPNLPTFNNIPNPFHLWSKEK